jgi:hypothetical protein
MFVEIFKVKPHLRCLGAGSKCCPSITAYDLTINGRTGLRLKLHISSVDSQTSMHHSCSVLLKSIAFCKTQHVGIVLCYGPMICDLTQEMNI